MGLFSSKKPVSPGIQPHRDWPWNLIVNGVSRSAFGWEEISRGLDQLETSAETFIILKQVQGDDYWLLQSAVALAGPHAGQHTVECGWSAPGGPRLLAWYGGAAEAAEKLRTVWEGRPLDFTGFGDLSHTLPANQRKQRLQIACRVVGEIGTNCYFVTDRTAGLTAVIDPGGDGARLAAELKKLGTRVQYLLLTHGHYDHADALPELAAAFPDAAVYLHERDFSMKSPLFPVRRMVEDPACPLKKIHFYRAFRDRDIPPDEAEDLLLGELRIHPIHTPGHSEGSVSLRISGGPIFCGDALFKGSCGRTDFPGGDVEKMMDTLRLFGQMRDDAEVFPGHMDSTTLAEEQAHNPYLRQAMNGGF